MTWRSVTTKRSLVVETFEPISKEDLLKVVELAKVSPALAEYIKFFSLFRMSFLGHIERDELVDNQLNQIIDQFDRDGKVQLPPNYETARNLLLKIREKKDFELIFRALLVLD